MPFEDFVYLADTARLPYGTKSPEAVTSYALQAARLLIEEGVKLIVVACNTASASALLSLKAQLPNLPCFGVIEPGAQAAAGLSPHGRIAVLATEGTVRSGAYETAIIRQKPFAHVRMLACNLLVSLVEEGWCEGPEAETVLKRYLQKLGAPGMDYDTLVLGCTHFPLLAPMIRKLIGPKIPIVDSAVTTAESVRAYLEAAKFRKPGSTPGQSRFFVTDAPERFSHLAARFVPDNKFAPHYNVFHTNLDLSRSAQMDLTSPKKGSGTGP